MSERTSGALRQEAQRALVEEEKKLEQFFEDIGVTDWARIMKKDAEDLVARLFGEK